MDYRLFESLNEKQKRLFLGQCAEEYGYGGITKAANEYHVSRTLVSKGLKEHQAGETYRTGDRIRKAGGGRKRKTEEYPDLEKRIIEMAEADNGTYGTPTDERKWTTMSCRKASRDLANGEVPMKVSPNVISAILKKNHYSRQQNRKMKEVSDPGPHRDEQFEQIAKHIEEFQRNGEPVISIDTKKRKS